MARMPSPPLDVAPAAMKEMLAIQTGHMGRNCLSFLRGGFGPFQISGEPVERALPEFPILFDPLRCLLQRFGVQLHFVHTSVAAASQQSSLLQDAEMF